jgi:hypothetical protein
MSEDERKSRAAQRLTREHGVAIRAFRMQDEPLLDQRVETTPDERVREVLRLSYEAFALSGQPWPQYSRTNIPGRVIRPTMP